MNKKLINQYKVSVCEQLYPLFSAVLITCVAIYVLCKYDITFDTDLHSVISNIIVFVSIIIGFIGVLLGILLGLKNEERMEKFLSIIEKDILKRYFKEPMIAGVGSIMLGCSIFFQNEFDSFFTSLTYQYLTVSKVLICIWLFCTVYMIVSAYRIVDFMFEVIFSKEEIQEREIISENENTKKQLKDRYS